MQLTSRYIFWASLLANILGAVMIATMICAAPDEDELGTRAEVIVLTIAGVAAFLGGWIGVSVVLLRRWPAQSD